MKGIKRLALLIVLAGCATLSSNCLAQALAEAVADLRRECFDYLEGKLANGPIKDVPWSNRQRLTFDKVDIGKELLSSNFSGLSVDLKFKSIANEELVSLMRTAAGPALSTDLKPAVLTAALLASDEQFEKARVLVDKAMFEDLSADVRYQLWIKKLGLEKPEKPKSEPVKPVEAKAETGTTTSTTPTPATPATPVAGPSIIKHAVAKDHPRLLGNRARLLALAAARPDSYKNMATMAKRAGVPDFLQIPSMALVSCIEGDVELGKKAVQVVMKFINGPIRIGHETFGHDLAYCALVYDFCYSSWTADERTKFINYMNKTVDSNVNSESSVVHNGYYGYKNWGIGLACYATMYENPKATEYLQRLDSDFRARATQGLEVTGEGGGWAEGHYIHYWIYEWLFFCEVARWCEGVDYFPLAPKFFRNRAIASIFEMYPGSAEHLMNAPVPMGDGGYGNWGGHTERILAARRILASYYRNDPAHQAVASYNAFVKSNVIPEYSYMDFLWNDRSVPKLDLSAFKLSHYSAGPSYVAARSSWEGDATYLFFRCGKRYGAHQHMDVGHFMIFKHEQLIGDGGLYDGYSSDHVSNYYMRSIAHNTMLIFDPAEKFPGGMRAFANSDNDGGQDYGWMSVNHNGGVVDIEQWNKNRKVFDVAEMLAYDDQRAFVYSAGDCTRAYASTKLDCFTRQIVFLRPNTVVVFDRVAAKHPNYKKTFLLQAQRVPTGTAPNLVISNGKGRVFVQTVLPLKPVVKLNSGKDLYSYGGKAHAPTKDSDEVPKCRIEISPSNPSATDYFLHVFTTTESTVQSVPEATAKVGSSDVTLNVAGATIKFQLGSVGGSVSVAGQTVQLTNKIAGN